MRSRKKAKEPKLPVKACYRYTIENEAYSQTSQCILLMIRLLLFFFQAAVSMNQGGE